jgi:hypothetical protein
MVRKPSYLLADAKQPSFRQFHDSGNGAIAKRDRELLNEVLAIIRIFHGWIFDARNPFGK